MYLYVLNNSLNKQKLFYPEKPISWLSVDTKCVLCEVENVYLNII